MLSGAVWGKRFMSGTDRRHGRMACDRTERVVGSSSLTSAGIPLAVEYNVWTESVGLATT